MVKLQDLIGFPAGGEFLYRRYRELKSRSSSGGLYWNSEQVILYTGAVWISSTNLSVGQGPYSRLDSAGIHHDRRPPDIKNVLKEHTGYPAIYYLNQEVNAFLVPFKSHTTGGNTSRVFLKNGTAAGVSRISEGPLETDTVEFSGRYGEFPRVLEHELVCIDPIYLQKLKPDTVKIYLGTRYVILERAKPYFIGLLAHCSTSGIDIEKIYPEGMVL